MQVLLPWIQQAMTDQPKEPENSDLCQTLSRIIRLCARFYGTPKMTPEHCICEG
ncbi:hypothetical protein [Embleya sp. AB8]|uniref:hypothetical protein n=1 Tax=Embleya sp. AB8 TaxID=3156304 RepID=UPI003C764B6E